MVWLPEAEIKKMIYYWFCMSKSRDWQFWRRRLMRILTIQSSANSYQIIITGTQWTQSWQNSLLIQNYIRYFEMSEIWKDLETSPAISSGIQESKKILLKSFNSWKFNQIDLSKSIWRYKFEQFSNLPILYHYTIPVLETNTIILNFQIWICLNYSRDYLIVSTKIHWNFENLFCFQT